MPADDSTGYKYTVPLETVGGVEQPTYQVAGSAEVLDARYTAGSYVAVTNGAVPHLHKDSVDVTVERVDTSEYGGE
jgi:hypothetical protein